MSGNTKVIKDGNWFWPEMKCGCGAVGCYDLTTAIGCRSCLIERGKIVAVTVQNNMPLTVSVSKTSKHLDCTNYCLQCEESAKKVEELQQKLDRTNKLATPADFTLAENKRLRVQVDEAIEQLKSYEQLFKDATKAVNERAELQRQNAMLVDALKEHIEYVDHSTGSGRDRELHNKAAVAYFATSAQSAAWLEASHIEWMKGLPSMAFVGENSLGRYIVSTEKGIDLEVGNQLYAIPTKKD